MAEIHLRFFRKRIAQNHFSKFWEYFGDILCSWRQCEWAGSPFRSLRFRCRPYFRFLVWTWATTKSPSSVQRYRPSEPSCEAEIMQMSFCHSEPADSISIGRRKTLGLLELKIFKYKFFNFVSCWQIGTNESILSLRLCFQMRPCRRCLVQAWKIFQQDRLRSLRCWWRSCSPAQRVRTHFSSPNSGEETNPSRPRFEPKEQRPEKVFNYYFFFHCLFQRNISYACTNYQTCKIYFRRGHGIESV